MAQLQCIILLLTFTNLFISVNKCNHAVWPGILSNAGVAPLSTTGFSLQKGESKTLNAPSSWGGRFWGRTQCSEDSTGKFTCVIGDCGSGKLDCTGGGAAPPATLAEFTLDGSGGMDFYDVGLVDGYNLPMLVVPQGGTGANCTNTGCVVDLNGACHSELKVSNDGASVACKSACEAFNQAQYCCSGAYNSPDTCKPSSYSQVFNGACPRAYSYAYDDKTSTFSCAGADYVITFCPPESSWDGQFWGQTQCSEDSTRKFTCVTGDCGSGKLDCAGSGAAPPATLAEFTLDGSGGMDFYDVGLVDGYNFPMLVVPQGGTRANSTNTGCVVDLNGSSFGA